MLATSSSVYAIEDHAVQHSLRGSTLDEDSTTDEELYSRRWHRHRPNRGFHSSGGNCCGVPVGGTCPAGYESDTMIGSMNGMELCCRDLQNVVITGSPPKCKGSTRAPPKPKAQGAVPCILSGTRQGGTMYSCPDGMVMSLDFGEDGVCTCTPSSARKRPLRMPRKPRTVRRAPRAQRWSGQCNVVNNAMSRGIGCLNVGDDQSTCEACGCRYVAPARMCVQ